MVPRFSHLMRPKSAVGAPCLAFFCNMLLKALCSCLHGLGNPCRQAIILSLIGKCQVAPPLGIRISQGKLQSIVILHRLILVVIEAFPVKFWTMSTFTDLMCSINALKNTRSPMKQYFTNCVSEIIQLQAQIKKFAEELVPVHHIVGTLNAVDLGTRGHANRPNIRGSSEW